VVVAGLVAICKKMDRNQGGLSGSKAPERKDGKSRVGEEREKRVTRRRLETEGIPYGLRRKPDRMESGLGMWR